MTSVQGFSFNLDDLREVIFYDDAVALLEERGYIRPGDLDRLTGFSLLPGHRKGDLTEVPFLILEYQFRTGAVSQEEYAESLIITTDHRKLILRDSSQGIYTQLKALYAERMTEGNTKPQFNVPVKKGLRFEEREYTDPFGKTTLPRTYFLDM